ncbi:hypothetical protein DUNSADRAFT_12074 [Dunaliella salina]|uniref:Encoded protein n=1 Tax=Dunaliella salina TaxID=3046 RepID=A0ABQ7H440_DUNSA|nr:hypothetical protein DUNSADRAFT_12074 [Dunaliella salina]|eukprot:KAF5841618.1 hypothetical protein DUNSADRAFT_12074 [Dunaliella salina]
MSHSCRKKGQRSLATVPSRDLSYTKTPKKSSNKNWRDDHRGKESRMVYPYVSSTSCSENSLKKHPKQA